MIELWLSAGLLLLVALGMLLVPVLRHRRAHTEVDRTAVNVEAYQARVAELEAQQQAGLLDEAQVQHGRDEAARELLTDAEQSEPARSAHLGRGVPLTAAALVPLVALGLYLSVGASDRVALTQSFAQPPKTLQDMTSRLERTVAVQPDSVESLYFLGRAYMAEQRFADAAHAFERAAALSGTQPELLGQWAQAVYFADGKRWSPQVQALTDQALKADPGEPTSLGLLGIAAFEGQRYADAIAYWKRLLATLPAGDASRAALQGGIDRATAKLAEQGGDAARAPVTDGPRLTVRVSLAQALAGKVEPQDSVYIFARAVSGPPMPVAARRVTVAQLPVEVTLTDADAMVSGMKLSTAGPVQLFARVSRAGQPTQGEWIGQGAPLPSDVHEVQHLIIDRPDTRELRP
ncbi:c-type cytochrome biogenesis protein CcmI [Enterobacterales bacterium AW_CKDN230030176-1A_HGKHYDSX7]